MSETPVSQADDSLDLAARRLRWVLPLLIAIATAVAFYPALDNGFVWDDEAALVHNEHIQSLSASNLWWMLTTTYTGPYQPLAWLSLAIDEAVWGGKTAWGYHFTSIVLHACAAVVFFLVAGRVLAAVRGADEAPGPRDRPSDLAGRWDVGLCWGAGAATVLFALHPLRVESVAWATERRDVLSGLFFLLTLLSYLRHATMHTGAPDRTRRYVMTLCLYVLALLSKATTVTLPVVLILLDVYPLRRMRPQAGGWRSPIAERVLREKIPFVVLALIAGLVALAGQSEAGAMMDLAKHGVLGRILVPVAGIGFYLIKTVLPIGLSPMYELPPSLSDASLWLGFGGLVAVGVTVAVVLARKRLPSVATVWLAYVVLLLPVLGIVQVGVQMAADRYSYLPSLSLALLFGGLVLAWWRRTERGRPPALFRPAASLVIVVAGALGALTWRQCTFWQNDVTLWWRALSIRPDASVAYFNLATELQGIPGRRERAIELFRAAVSVREDYMLAWQNLGNALIMDGKQAEALEAYEEVLKRDPRNTDILANKGLALIGLDRFAEAVESTEKAIAADPKHAASRNILGMALIRLGKVEEGMLAYRRAVDADPTYVQSYENLVGTLVRLARYGEAAGVLRLAIKHMPDHLEMANRLAYLLATCPRDDDRNGAEALQLALEICRKSKYRSVSHLNTLAAAYAETGDFERAVQSIQTAINLIQVTNPGEASRLRARRESYAARQPLRPTSY